MTKVIKMSDIDELVSAVNAGKVVAFPTETVYGLGVQFNNEDALNRLMDAKNRDYSKSITLMVASKDQIEDYAVVSEDAKNIIQSFMPGMLTMVFKKKPEVSKTMTSGKDTIGIRIPDHEFVLSLLEKAGPMLVTSANLSDHPNTTNTQEVLEQLNNRIDYIVDGSTHSNIASTVIDVSQGDIRILREGIIKKDAIEEVIR